VTVHLAAAASIGAAGMRAAVSGYIRQADAVTALEMSALRTGAELARAGARGDAGFGGLAADCAARLRARLARLEQAPRTTFFQVCQSASSSCLPR